MDTDELVQEFITESTENLDQLDQDFIALEQSPDDPEILSRIFRSVHTIKGTCGFFGYSKLESVTHVGENLLSKLRDGELALTPPMTSALLRMVDAVRQILDCLGADGTEGDGDYSELVDALAELVESSPGEPADGTGSEPESAAANVSAEEHVVTEDAPPDVESQEEAEAPPSDPVLESAPEATEGTIPGSRPDATIRVDVRLLDQLMNMVGELVLSRNQTLQHIGSLEHPELQAASQQLNLITTELQEAVMKTRMQPIGGVWNKFPRVVRDLSVSLGKQVSLVMEGQDTELDKTILEAIKDPLTHIVRNSVDHGIEGPEARIAAGKPSEGTLTLRAYHEGGQVIIEVADDGAGINTRRVAEKAVERGVLSQGDVERMSERELCQLIFAPGFSTAEKVTNVSGRGVGMDVVRTNIEKIGGSIDLHSETGAGSTLKIKIPLTLAIIPALIVTCREGRYAIPQVNLLELVRLEGEEALNRIECVHGASVYRLRGKLLPLVTLHELLRLGEPDSASDSGDPAAMNIVVLQTEDQPFGLVVGGIHDTEEIVVKPLGKQLQHLDVFAGAAVMGDGRVSLILDVVGIARAGSIISENRRSSYTDAPAEDEASLDVDSTLVALVGDVRVAMPLSTVARLEEFDSELVEHAGEMDVIQYRENIMPLVYLDRCLGNGAAADSASAGGLLQVVVYRHEGRDVGFVVDRILDITQEAIAVKGRSYRSGVQFNAVIEGKVTECIEPEEFLSTVVPELSAAASLEISEVTT